MALWITHTAEGVDLRQDLAGAGSRALAATVDLAILGALLFVVLIVLGVSSNFDGSGASGFLLGLVVGGMFLFVVAYWTVFELLWGGQTPGKRLLRLQVRSLDGGPVQPLQVLLRNAFVLLDLFLPIPLPLGFVLAAATPLSQRIGDLAAGTMVVRLPRERPALREPWPGEHWSALHVRVLPLSPALAARFTRADTAYLRHLLARAEPVTLSELEPDVRRKLYVETARELCARVGVERFDDARVVLRELYLFLREMQPGGDAAQRTRSNGK